MKIEFVSYDGKYPNLCSGELILKVDGAFEHFCSGYREGEELHKHPSLWATGGGCGFINGDYSNEYVDTAPWIIDGDYLPEHLKPFAGEIEELFNSNVSHGCCGGCL